MAVRTYAERVCEVMDLEAPPTIRAQPLRKSVVEFSRIASQSADNGILQPPTADAFLISLQLRALPAGNAWVDGRHYLKDESKPGNFTLVNFNLETAVELNFQFDCLQMYFPRAALDAIALEQGAREVSMLDLDFVKTYDDVVLWRLGRCLLPAFDNPERANRLFVDHVATALLAHMVHAYGGRRRRPRWRAGGSRRGKCVAQRKC